MSENKIKFGLKNVYRAAITDNNGSITYGTPVAIPGAVTLTLKSVFETADIPADDDPEYAKLIQNKGYDGDIEFVNFRDIDRVGVLGSTIDSNGCLVESEDDQPIPQAIMFEFDGDKKATRHILYNCYITKPDIDGASKGDKLDNKSDKLTIKARPSKDLRIVKYKTTDTTPTNVYNAWFTSVQLPNTSRNTKITPDDVIFDKKTANQSDININIIKVGSETLTAIKENGIAISDGTDYSVTGNIVTLKKTYLVKLSESTHNLNFEFSEGVTKILEVVVINTEV